MKVLFLTEGNNKLGLGHVISCLSLYQVFLDESIKPTIILDGDDSAESLLKGVNYLKMNWKEKNNFKKLLQIIKNSAIIIIDCMFYNLDLFQEIAKKTKVPVYIDYNKKKFPKGIVIDRSILAEKIKYKKQKEIIRLQGIKYFSLTKAFWYAPEKIINKTVNSVLITFGGSDPREMTPKVLKFMIEEFPDLHKIVIIGKAFENIELIRLIKDENTLVYYYPTGETIKNIMLDIDISISAGGYTLYELARIGVPTIALSVADNQTSNIDGLMNMNFIEYAGKWDDDDLLKKVKNLINKLSDYNLRKTKMKIGRSLVDGYGGVRLVNYLLGFAQNR